ncbi:TniQ family protein [Herbaspirillum rubrisubalbicans]
MKRPVYLPYYPAVYPGEICGSWLSRIKFHNTLGIWNSVLASLGIFQELRFRVFDLHQPPVALSLVLHYLGTTLHDAMASMSTVPYSRTFDAATPSRRHHLPRFCSLCIADDIESHGEPYWHTEHQLPNVLVCRLHAVLLRDRCPACDKILATKNKFLVEPLTHNCICGADLRALPRRKISTTHKLYALSEISYHALSEKGGSLDLRQIIAFLLKKTKSAQGLHQLLQHVWGRHPEVEIFWSTDHALTNMRASDIAAALVALGLKYDEAIGKITSPATHGYLTQGEKRRNKMPATLDDAKRSMCDFSERFPGKRLAMNKVAYEYLLIHDLDWLNRVFPSERPRRLPSIHSDRQSIHSTIQRCAESGKPHFITTYPEHIRAQIRDSAWLDAYRAKAKKKSGPKDETYEEKSQSRVSELIEAIRLSETLSTRPRKITTRTLSWRLWNAEP